MKKRWLLVDKAQHGEDTAGVNTLSICACRVWTIVCTCVLASAHAHTAGVNTLSVCACRVCTIVCTCVLASAHAHTAGSQPV